MQFVKKTVSLALASTMLLNTVAFAAAGVTLQPAGGPGPAKLINDPAADPKLSTAQLTKLIQNRVKYVFVIFHENHSFDNEYGTFPGVNGLYSDGQNARSAANTPGFVQTYNDANGLTVSVQPFKIGPAQSANVVDSVDHGHTGLAKKLAVLNGTPQMSGFAQDEFTGKAGAAPAAGSAAYKKGAQFANLVMSHVDCDTIPFFWQWASNFTIFDNIFATEDTPSTPNAVAMLAGQSGETQSVKHPSATSVATATGYTAATTGIFLQNTAGGAAPANNGAGLNSENYGSGQLALPTSTVANPATSTTQGPPLVNDPQPFYGSAFDTTVANGSTVRQPYGPYEGYAPSNTASNLTFASLPLTLMGGTVQATMNLDLNPAFDNADIQNDVPYIQGLNRKPVNWAWYQNGYAMESSDTLAGQTAASHWAFVSHHQGPQYFGYLANNPGVTGQATVPGAAGPVNHLKGETDFFTDVAAGLPGGGVFYVRGGYINQQGQKALYNNPALTGTALTTAQATVAATKSGDDDHPAYSDRQISEGMTANIINAIAGNPALWAQSAIIITYDESDGFYDHVPPRILSYGPDGLPLSRGIRVPLLLISPFARSHAVSHVEGDHNAVIQTINAIFNLPALASLPDEAAALTAGNSPYFNQFGPAGFQQNFLGPHDINSSISDSLLSGFDPKRLMGTSAPLPATLAQIPAAVVSTLPHAMSCSSLNLTPVAPASDNVVPQVLINNGPVTAPVTSYDNFNNLPSTLPSLN